MATIRKRRSKFTQVHNVLLSDNRLSLKAIGLFCYMFSKPDKWHFTVRSMATQLKDGRDSIGSALKELKSLGYVKYKRFSDGTGEYFLDDSPCTENTDKGNPCTDNPHAEKPYTEKPHAENTDELVILYPSNTDLLSNTKRETRALDFLQKENPSLWETFCMKHKSRIKDFKKFCEDFNDVFDTEQLDYKSKVILARLNRYARNWIENQAKYQIQSVKPVYRNKVS